MKKLIFLVCLFSLPCLSQTREDIKRQMDSLSAILNNDPATAKKQTRLVKIEMEIDSLEKVKSQGTTAALTGLGIQLAAYFLVYKEAESNLDKAIEGKQTSKSSPGLFYGAAAVGLWMEISGLMKFQSASTNLSTLRAKKYDLMNYE